MNIIGKGKIYLNQYGYSITDNQKKQDGTYENHYISVSFPKSMKELPNNGDFIEIEGFTKPYKDKQGKTVMTFMVMKWKLVNASQNTTPAPAPTEQKQETDPYAEFGQEYQLDENDLPF